MQTPFNGFSKKRREVKIWGFYVNPVKSGGHSKFSETNKEISARIGIDNCKHTIVFILTIAV